MCWAHLQPSGSLEKGGAQSAQVRGPWAGVLVLCLTSLRRHIYTDYQWSSSLNLQHPGQATQNPPHILRVGMGPACAKRGQAP